MADPKEIFVFHDGERQRYADPFATLKALHFQCAQAKQQLGALWQQAGNPDILQSYDAWTLLQPITCQVFGLKPFDPETGAGLTADKVERILDSFVDYLAAKKKSAAT